MGETRKSVLITGSVLGCSPGGIGYALAKEFHAQGCRVFATARNSEVLKSLPEMETFQLDVCSAEDIARVKREIEALTGGGLDILVNNAGRTYVMPALDIEAVEVRALFETDLFAVMKMCQEFSSLLIQSQGTIVQIGSVSGLIPMAFSPVYGAAKAALHAYSDYLRIELAPFGVKVTTIITGGVKSNIARTHLTLPATSRYLPIVEGFQRRISFSQESTMPTEQYAHSVATQVLRRNPKKTIWAGSNVWRIWLIHTFLPKWIFENYFTNVFSLWKLKRLLQKKRE